MAAAPAGIGGAAWECARLGFEALQARARGDEATAEQKENELKGGTCDPSWAETLVEYANYFGLDGTRGTIPYITPAVAGDWVVEIPDGARIAMLGDWGTGTQSAITMLRQVKQQQPDILVHLGDVYYSGTADECQRNFRAIIDDVFDRPNHQLPVFNMAGNHDMYSGGQGFYDLLRVLNPPPLDQKASFFCLRTTNKAWQFLAMDTGLHDFDPLAVTDVVTFIDPAEEAWHLRRLNEIKESGGQTILLSHHQLFSAFSAIGPEQADGFRSPCNPKLLTTFNKFQASAPIAAWFWGHEHNLCIYEPYAELAKGRCIGHGAVPVMTSQNPYVTQTDIKNAPALVPATQLGVNDRVYAHGYTMISLDPAGGPAKAQYYSTTAPETPMYEEMLG